MSVTIQKANGLDLALMVALALIWASAFQAIKIVVPETGPAWLVVSRVGVALIALLPWAVLRGVILPRGCRQWTLVLLIVLLNVLAPFFLIGWAELTISSGETALILGAGPLIGLVASHLTTKDDTLTRRKLMAVMVGFSGVALVIGTDALKAIGTTVAAQGAVLLASACYVCSGLLIRRVDGIPPARLTALTFALATLVIVPIAFIKDGVPPAPSRVAAVAMIYLGLFPTGIAAVLRIYLIRRVGVSMFAHVSNLIPVFGVALGALILGEAVGSTTMIALLLILGGVALARAGSKPEN